MPIHRLPQLPRRIAAETGLLLVVGVFLGLIGPFGTSERGPLVGLIYWPTVIIGGGVIGIAIDLLIQRRVAGFWPRLTAVSLLMTVPVSLMVATVGWLMFGPQGNPRTFAVLLFQVFVISVAVMALRQLAWRGVWTERHAPAEAVDAVDPTVAFRRRLSAKRRTARLLAVQAEDHYLRVHTDAGEELVTLRFSDALHELASAAGYQTHRSWWVAAGAIEAVRWRRGRGELRLGCGLVVPVSRSRVEGLKRDGWF